MYKYILTETTDLCELPFIQNVKDTEKQFFI